jgi:hypothetical protein
MDYGIFLDMERKYLPTECDGHAETCSTEDTASLAATTTRTAVPMATLAHSPCVGDLELLAVQGLGTGPGLPVSRQLTSTWGCCVCVGGGGGGGAAGDLSEHWRYCVLCSYRVLCKYMHQQVLKQ